MLKHKYRTNVSAEISGPSPAGAQGTESPLYAKLAIMSDYLPSEYDIQETIREAIKYMRMQNYRRTPSALADVIQDLKHDWDVECVFETNIIIKDVI